MDKSLATEWIKAKATELGFLHVGITKAEHMDDEARKLESWLNKGYQGEMAYMDRHFEKRVDPSKLVPNAKSVISLSFNYYSPKKQEHSTSPKISSYAYGRDYHKVVKSRLKKLFLSIQDRFGQIEGRYFVDSAPVLERDLAKRAGLGWIGKNTMLIHPKMGSFFFLAEVILDMDLEFDAPMKDYCGSCTKCIDACPTDAISENGYIMDGSRCISYLTIELKNAIPDEFEGKMDNWMFGCDICQDVCPWNRFSKPHQEEDFEPLVDLLSMKSEDWYNLNKETFDHLFQGSAVKRTKFAGLKRNIEFLKKS